MRKRASRKKAAPKEATPEQAKAIVAAVAKMDAQTITQADRVMAPEQPRSRYEGDEIMETDESIYLPPHMNLEAMTKEQIGATSMRYFGHRPPENATKEVQIAQVQRELRAGLPGYGRGR